MTHFLKVFTLSFIAFLQPLSDAMAADLAMVIGNRKYKNASWVNGAERVVTAGRRLRNSGYTVVSGRDLLTAQSRASLRGLIDRMDDADRVVIVLAGHFVHSDADTWFLPVDADAPSPSSVNYEGLSLHLLLDVLAEKPGGAALFLGTYPRSISTSGGIQAGIGLLDIPQGVFVATGRPEDIDLTIRRDFLTEGVGFAEALKTAPDSVFGTGFVSDLASLLPPEPIEIDPTEFRDDGYWQAVQDFGSAIGVQSYLNAFPNGKYANEARDWLEAQANRSPEDEAKEAEKTLKLSRGERRKIQENLSLLGFDTHGVDGILGRGSRTAIGNWQDAQDFEPTGYLSRRQINRLANQAKRRAAKLAEEARRAQRELEDADRAYWSKSGAEAGNEKGLRRYLRRYPDGLFADIALARQEAIAEEKRNNVSHLERSAWEFAVAENTSRAYDVYLAQYPNGIFADEARAKLAELQNDDAAEAARLAAEQQEAGLHLNGFGRVLVEQQLTALGFDAGSIDGNFDKNARRAIRQFQRTRGFDVTGYLTRQTIVRLIAESGG